MTSARATTKVGDSGQHDRSSSLKRARITCAGVIGSVEESYGPLNLVKILYTPLNVRDNVRSSNL